LRASKTEKKVQISVYCGAQTRGSIHTQGASGRQRTIAMAGSTTLHSNENDSRPHAPSAALERFSYDDGVVRAFMMASVAWGIVGMLVGVLAALQLADPRFNLGLEWLSFGRIRPLHTNAVIFAFAGLVNPLVAAVLMPLSGLTVLVVALRMPDFDIPAAEDAAALQGGR
jgi:hypothetical protein